MAETLQVTVSSTPVSVAVTQPAAAPVTVAAAQAPLSVSVAAAQAPLSVSAAVETTPQSVVVEVTDAPPGANAEHVILTLAEYLALAPEVQMDGRWYLIPKA